MQRLFGIVGLSTLALLGTMNLSCLATTAAPPVGHTFPVRTRTLPSGMRVIIEQDDGAGIVGVACVVDVGQDDDPPLRPGLAHMAEHLVYSLPDQTGPSTWRRLIDLGAGNINAETAPDRTTFYAFAPRAILDDLVGVFLARLDVPARGLDEERLARERRVLNEELALRQSDASQGVRLSVNALMNRPVLPEPAAVRASLDAISLDDVRAFLGTHYQPERMTLILSGAIPPDWDLRLLERLPADLLGVAGERRMPVRHPLAQLDVTRAPRPEIASVTADVTERELWLAWSLPPAHGKDEVPFRLTADLAEGLLTTKAEAGEVRLISRASALIFSSAAAEVFLLRLTLRPGADPEAARKEARDLLELLSFLPITESEQSARRRAELDLQAARLREALPMESLVSRTLRRAAIAHDNPEESVSDVLKAVIETSLQGICDVVTRHLSGPPARSVLLTPRSGVAASIVRASLPASAEPTENPADTDTEERPESEETAPHDARAVTAIAQAPGTSAARESKLSNGLTLIVLRRPGLPVATMLLGFHANPMAGEDAGLRVAARLARSFRLSQGPLERAILQTASIDLDDYVDTFQMFSPSAESAIDLLWKEASGMSVNWPTPKANAWLQQLAINEATASGHLSRTLAKTLFGAHPYAPDIQSERLRSLTTSDIRTWIDRVRRPANGVLVVVGDVDPSVVERDADDALSDWIADASTAPPPPEPPQVDGQGRPLPVLTASDPSRTWTKLQFGCFLPPVRSPRDSVVGALVTESLRDDLFQRLRVELGASYAPILSDSYYRGGTQLLTGTIDVDPKAAPRARALLHDWLDPASTAALEPRAIEKARWRSARGSGLRNATNLALARRLFAAWNMGWSPQSLDAYPQNLASVTPAEVMGALAACRRSAVLSVLAP